MNYFELHKISETSLNVFTRLSGLAEERNVKIYVVGGFVRDLLLNHEVEDIDIVVEGDAIAFAHDFKKKHGGSKVVSYGRFGTAMLNHRNLKLEFATAREEYYDADSRKPHVNATNIQTDLSRRDFTINAMAVSLNKKNTSNWGELIDPFNGQVDLKKRIIKTPLEAEITYYDDPLRMLRAVRFASRLNFTIEPESLKAIEKMDHRMEIISQERVTDELQKMLLHKKPSGAINLLLETGLMPIILPELNILVNKDAYGYSLLDITKRALDYVADKEINDVILRLAVLFIFIGFKSEHEYYKKTINDSGREAFLKTGRKMKLPVKMFEIIAKIIQYQNLMRKLVFVQEENRIIELRTFLIEINSEFDMTLLATEAVQASIFPEEEIEKKINDFLTLVKEQEKIENWRNFKLALSGNEIMDILNISEGKDVGKVKKELIEQIINGKIKNEKEKCQIYLKNKKFKLT